MRMLIAAALLAIVACGSFAADEKGTEVTWAGLKATTPATWKKEEIKNDTLGIRVALFKLAKAEGDKDDAEIVVFFTKGGGGIDANVKRQFNAFEPSKGDEKLNVKEEKTKVGKFDGKYVDIKGTFLKKAFPMAKEGTPMADYRQIYVVFEDDDGAVGSVWLRGPAKTVEKHKKDFDGWIKSFK